MSHLLINTTIHCYCRCPAVTTSSCCSTSTTTKLSHLHYITTCSRYITRSPPIISQNSPLLLQLSSHRPLQSSVKTPQCCFNCPVTVPSNHQSKLPNVASTVQSPSPPIISQNQESPQCCFNCPVTSPPIISQNQESPHYCFNCPVTSLNLWSSSVSLPSSHHAQANHLFRLQRKLTVLHAYWILLSAHD